jgi:hypothetical protein
MELNNSSAFVRKIALGWILICHLRSEICQEMLGN